MLMPFQFKKKSSQISSPIRSSRSIWFFCVHPKSALTHCISFVIPQARIRIWDMFISSIHETIHPFIHQSIIYHPSVSSSIIHSSIHDPSIYPLSPSFYLSIYPTSPRVKKKIVYVLHDLWETDYGDLEGFIWPGLNSNWPFGAFKDWIIAKIVIHLSIFQPASHPSASYSFLSGLLAY